ncbi:Clavaminate synthase-like protein [Agrocybe pediades]|nr:Clavaminate synthase-like protein [Agrocybe pediades]
MHMSAEPPFASSAPRPELFLALKRTESTFEEIPVIDIRDARSEDPVKRRKLADLIRDACINVGFFYIQSHGIPDKVIENTVNAGKRFFALPEETKMQLDIHKTTNFKGYTALLGENTDAKGLGDLHEGFDIGWEPSTKEEGDKNGVASPSPSLTREDGVMTGGNVWPEGLPGFKEPVLEYYHRALEVGKLLFPLFALALDLPENFFDDKTTKPAAIMRLLHYPPQSPTSFEADPDGRQIGIGAHTDYECFTILWQDRAGGLQVQNTAGKWVDAVPIPGTLVVNLGDQFARWTNDIFKSTLHRVINRSGEERYSIPLFFGTNYDVLLEPISTCVTPGAPYKYEVMTAGEYVKSRLEATYSHSVAV